MKPDVVVIGSGPAGLMAALTAGKNGKKVTLLEALPSPGRKLLASGAGKCNFTNMLTAENMVEHFTAEQQRFIRPALLGFTPENARDFFVQRGIKYTLVDDFYCFPASEKSSDILNCFLNELNRTGVQIICNSEVTDIEMAGDKVISVVCGNKKYCCDYLIAAGGGTGFPQLGGGGSLDRIMQHKNIAFTARTPALCALKSQDRWLNDLAGIVLDNVFLSLDRQYFSFGTLLFTGEGVSGPAALDLAGRISRQIAGGQGHNVTVRANWKNRRTADEWLNILNKARRENGKRLIHNVLAGELPQAVINAIIEHINLKEVAICNLSRSDTVILLEYLTACPLNIYATENWQKAMASTGGIERRAIDSKTMQSRQISNLYFAGEFIDVDGPCGGYNIQWALSSGYLAGLLKSKKLK